MTDTPDHYDLPIQPVDYIVKNNLGFLEGNVIKYVTRHHDKGGEQDIKKAIHYLTLVLRTEYGIDASVTYFPLDATKPPLGPSTSEGFYPNSYWRYINVN